MTRKMTFKNHLIPFFLKASQSLVTYSISVASVKEDNHSHELICLRSQSAQKITFVVGRYIFSFCNIVLCEKKLKANGFNLAQRTLSLLHFHIFTFTLSLSCFHFHFHTSTFILSLSHFHFHTFTFTLPLSCFHFHTFTFTLANILKEFCYLVNARPGTMSRSMPPASRASSLSSLSPGCLREHHHL